MSNGRLNKPKTEKGRKLVEFLKKAEVINISDFKKQFGYHPTQARPKYVKKNFYKTKEKGVWVWRRKKEKIQMKEREGTQDVVLATLVEVAQRQERVEALLLKIVEGKKWAKYWKKKQEQPTQAPQIDENAWINDLGKDLGTSRIQTQGLLDTLKLEKEVQMKHIFEQFGCDIARLITVLNRFISQIEKYVGGTISISAFSVKVK